jgi:protocatechuate 3,4-dioxygenase beta subunit
VNRDLLLVIALVLGLGVVFGAMWGLGVFSDDDATRIEAPNSSIDEGDAGSGPRRDQSLPKAGVAEGEGNQGGGAPSLTTSVDASDEIIEARDGFGVLLGGLDVMVTDPQGQALPDAVVTVFEDHAPGIQQHLRGEEIAATSTDTRGRVRIDDLRGDGEFILRIRHPDYVDAHLAPVSMTPGRYELIRYQLRDGLGLAGQVVDSESRAPLEGVSIEVQDLTILAPRFKAMVEREGQTDADGRYRLVGLGAGLKRIVVSREGYATSSHLRFSLTPEVAAAGLDFELSRGMSIQGTVTDPDGRPIANAEVSGIYQPLGSGKQRRHVIPVNTDDQGRYELAGLVEGYYTIMAAAEGYRTGSVLRQAGGAPRGEVLRSGSSSRNARAGDTDVELILLPSATVSGRVVDASTGEPVTAFEISISPRPVLIGRGGENTRRFVDEQGRFTMSSPLIDRAKKEIHVFAVAPGLAGGRVAVDVADLLNSEERVRVQGLEIRMTRGGSFKARIVDLEGGPVSGARVQVYPVEQGVDEASRLISVLRRFNRTAGKRGVSDQDGRVEIPGLLEGHYRVRIEHAEFASWDSENSLPVRENETQDLGRIELFRGGTVVGTVKDASGKRVNSALVRLSSLDLSNGEMREARTGLAGVFEFKNVRPGRYRLSATRPAAEGETQVLDLGALSPGSGPSHREFLIAEGEEMRANLEVR